MLTKSNKTYLKWMLTYLLPTCGGCLWIRTLTIVIRPGKIDHFGTSIVLKNINLKTSLSYNSAVVSSRCTGLALETQHPLALFLSVSNLSDRFLASNSNSTIMSCEHMLQLRKGQGGEFNCGFCFTWRVQFLTANSCSSRRTGQTPLIRETKSSEI